MSTTIDHLDDDVISVCLSFLSLNDLQSVQLCCKELYRIIVTNCEYREYVRRYYSLTIIQHLRMVATLTQQLEPMSDAMTQCWLSCGWANLAFGLTKLTLPSTDCVDLGYLRVLHEALRDPFDVGSVEYGDERVHSMLVDVVACSSCDHEEHEGPSNVLQDVDRRTMRLQNVPYWSSAGSSEHGEEHITFKLESVLCVLWAVDVAPYQCFFQGGFPTYAPRKIQIRIGFGDDENDDNGQLTTYHYESPVFDVLHHPSSQRFELDPPAVCCGDRLELRMVGKYEVQSIDNLYYTCLRLVRCWGARITGLDYRKNNDAHNSVLIAPFDQQITQPQHHHFRVLEDVVRFRQLGHGDQR